MNDLVSINFHGDEIQTWKDKDVVYVAMRRTCEDVFGLSWAAQYRKLTNDPLFSKHLTVAVTATDIGNKEVIGLDIEYLPIWLARLPVSRLKRTVQTKVLLYQEECAKALRDFWFKGQATHPQLKDPSLQAIITMSDQVKALVIELDTTRQVARQAQVESSQAKDLAIQTLHAVSWLAVSQYVYLHGLHHQLPPPMANAYGRYLTDYCIHRNIPMGFWHPYGKKWEKENTYPVSIIERLLPQWLLHRNSQGNITGLQIEEDGVSYGVSE